MRTEAERDHEREGAGVASALPVIVLYPDQDPEAAMVLGQAFANDPLLDAVLPPVTDPVERVRILTAVFAVALKHQRLRGQPVLGIIRGGEVAAVAITEGAQRLSTKTPLLRALGMLFRMIAVVGVAATLRAIRFTKETRRNRPHQPHLYLSAIGVAPAQQGRHYGTALLGYLRSLLTFHSEWIGIYLETANKANLRYYERAGYRLLGETETLGVTIWRMMQSRAELGE